MADWIEISRIRAACDLTPRGILQRRRLTRAQYSETAKNGHFGNPSFAWEQTDAAAKLS